jgi:hypothetical protein
MGHDTNASSTTGATCGTPCIVPWHCIADIVNSCKNSESNILQRYLVLDICHFFLLYVCRDILVPGDGADLLSTNLLILHGFSFFLVLCQHIAGTKDLILPVVQGSCCSCRFIRGYKFFSFKIG